jgi:hypothetical protein
MTNAGTRILNALARMLYGVRVLCGCGLALFFLAAANGPAKAQIGASGAGGSYITPFPGGERYKLRVIGDEFGEGIHSALVESLGSDPRLEIEKKPIWLSGLTRPNSVEELRDIARDVASEKPNIIVIMFGSMDRWSYRAPNGLRYSVGTAEWRSIYTQRIDALIRDFKSAGSAVYWVGLPIMRRYETNESAQTQNEVFRERVYLSGVRYIDVYQGFADEQGDYSAYGPDLAGKNRLLRDGDGMHMTDAGYQKLAHFVERAIKRDLARAKNVRAVPLAGNEAEQALINPAARAKPTGVSSWSTKTESGAHATGGGTGDEMAQTSRINLKTVGPDGAEQVLAIDIVRPAIPAAVLALVTRRESADRLSQMGDQVIDQIPGGLTVMSSITPGGDDSAVERRKLSPAQTPYFRVLVKGERIASRPGRADDVSWPPPESPAPPKALPQVVPNAAGPGGVPLPAAKPNR